MADDPIPDDTEPSGSRLGSAALVLAIGAVFALAIALTAVAMERIDAPEPDSPTDATASTTSAPASPSTSAPDPAAAGAGLNADGWPAAFDGAPLVFGTDPGEPGTVAADAPAGVYVWSDFAGWHVWVVNGEGVAGVRGRIDSDQPLAAVSSAEPDVAAIDVGGPSASFELPAEPRVTGIDLGLDFFAENLVVTLEGPDGPLGVEQVAVGAAAAPPAQVPLVIQKTPPG